MKTKKLSQLGFKLFLCLLSLTLAVPYSAYAQKDFTVTEVDTLRREREAKMPYLDKSFIHSEISIPKIKDKKEFLIGNEKSLDDLIRRAVAVYTPARASRERVSLARRRILVALRTLFPETSFEMNDRKGDLSDSAFNSFNYKFKFKQPIFRGGALWNTLLQEKAGLEAAEKEFDAAIADVINEVAAAYFEYNRALSVSLSQEKSVDTMLRYSEISEKKYKEDIISEIERLNVQSLASQVRYDHETSIQELELAKLELQKMLGLDLSDEVKIAPAYDVQTLLKTKEPVVPAEEEKKDSGPKKEGEDAANVPSPSEETAPPAEDSQAAEYTFGDSDKALTLNDLVDMSYANRPELRVEAAKLQSARLEERIRMGNFMPQADATLEFGKLGEAFNDQDLTPSLEREFRFMIEFNWNVGGNKIGYTHDDTQSAPTVSQFQGNAGSNTRRDTFTVGLLDGLKDFADAKEAEVLKLDQVNQLEKKEKEVIQDVKKSYFDYQKAKIQVKSSLQRVDYRQRLSQLSKHKLEKNEVQISEYLQSEIDLLGEVTTLHKALADYYTAKARLNHAIGVRNYLPLGDVNGRSNTGNAAGAAKA